MRISRRFAISAGPALFLSACATPSLYQPDDGQSGYAETQLGEGRWRVEFIGDELTSRETVETYLLYRAAELTVQNGRDWFAMTPPAVSEEIEIIVEAQRPQAYRERYWRPHWRRRDRSSWSDLDPVGPEPRDEPRDEQRQVREAASSESIHYSASAEIFMGDDPLATGAFNAQATIARLQGSVVRPPN